MGRGGGGIKNIPDFFLSVMGSGRGRGVSRRNIEKYFSDTYLFGLYLSSMS